MRRLGEHCGRFANRRACCYRAGGKGGRDQEMSLQKIGWLGFAGLALAGCNASGGGKIDSALGGVQAGQPAAAQVQDLRAYCPKTSVRAGTEKFDLYPPLRKKGETPSPETLRFRATITEVVRECNYQGDFLNIRVGIAGRVISGPAGETGSITLPVRVAVTEGGTLVYSQLHEVPATVEPGRTNGLFSYVDGAISLPKPAAENIVVQVGFDDTPPDPKAKKPQKPVN
jgi:hypothetical protein